jgi:NADPH:quinone reductase
MKAIQIKRFGGPDGLAVVDVPEPVAGPGQVVIAVEATGVAGADVVIRRGELAAYGFKEGHIPGGEVAGVVASVGPGVDAGWVGRRVWAATGTGGGYATLAVAPLEEVVPLPESLSAVDAVTIGGPGVVAHFALARAHFRAGESVLVRGASGSLGVMTVQLAARSGAGAVAVTTSSPARGRRLTGLGATHVLDRSGVCDLSFDVIIDVVAGPEMPSFFERLNPHGRLVAVGVVGGQPPAGFGQALMTAFQRSLSFATFSAASVPASDRFSVRSEHFTRGDLRAVVHEVLPLDQAALAHRKMDAGEVFGRIVLTV